MSPSVFHLPLFIFLPLSFADVECATGVRIEIASETLVFFACVLKPPRLSALSILRSDAESCKHVLTGVADRCPALSLRKPAGQASMDHEADEIRSFKKG